MPKAILSVYDKTGLVEFARGLVELGWELIASGGTARLLPQNSLPVTEVADYTGSPEILGGRVKTLHPAIHGGLLARDREADRPGRAGRAGLGLYRPGGGQPVSLRSHHRQTRGHLGDAIENIDIGGVTLIRAAAKNFERVTLAVRPGGLPGRAGRTAGGRRPAGTAPRAGVQGFCRSPPITTPPFRAYLDRRRRPLTLTLYPVQRLRYGENPHQSAALYSYHARRRPVGRQGAAGQGAFLQQPAGPGCSLARSGQLRADRRSASSSTSRRAGSPRPARLEEAYRLALASDPVSAYGGVIASNRPLDGATAAAIKAAVRRVHHRPRLYGRKRWTILAAEEELRLVEMPDLEIEPDFELRSITRGVLQADRSTSATRRARSGRWSPPASRPTEEWQALRFAWKACQHVKSNAIVFAQGERHGGDWRRAAQPGGLRAHRRRSAPARRRAGR